MTYSCSANFDPCGKEAQLPQLAETIGVRGMQSTGMDQQGVMAYLGTLLEQLEGAQGGVDQEAREKLELLKAQLRLMESAQQGGSEGPPAALHTEVAVAQELDSLDTRLTNLEQRLEGLDDDALQVVQQSVAGWVSTTAKEAATETGGGNQPGAT